MSFKIKFMMLRKPRSFVYFQIQEGNSLLVGLACEFDGGVECFRLCRKLSGCVCVLVVGKRML